MEADVLLDVRAWARVLQVAVLGQFAVLALRKMTVYAYAVVRARVGTA